MMVGIASGAYSSIFIASPVLTAWKEREPGFVRRRQRILAVEGSVPAFADEVELARVGEDGEESDAEIEAEIASQREERPKAGAVATVEPPVEGEGGKPSSNGEPPAADPAEIAKREREERRRSRRQQRRKHGRNR
jgi:SecD/SecF fusion protein